MPGFNACPLLILIAATAWMPMQKLAAQVADLWAEGRTYTYRVWMQDEQGHTMTDELLTLRPTGKAWEIDPNQTLAQFELNFSAADSARLAPFPPNGLQRPWMRRYSEGVMQTPTRVWMHPLRNNQYQYTEVAPFPEVRLPLEAGLKWPGTLWIYEGFGSFEGTVESKYLIEGQESRDYVFGPLDCWVINSVGVHDKLGTSSAVYYFHEMYGFTEMNYAFYNGYTLTITLMRMVER